MIQIASALRTIHANQLCARLVVPSKILVTGKNRIRLNGNGILDVLQLPLSSSAREIGQVEDLRQLGRLALALAVANPNPSVFATSIADSVAELSTGLTTHSFKALESLSRQNYSDRFKATVANLLDAGNVANTAAVRDAMSFASSIADYALNALDSSLQAEDTLASELMGTLENGRMVRLMAKLLSILERPESSPHDHAGHVLTSSDPASLHRASWSETGDRYFLKLFRDYVFHQVNEEGRPHVDLGHIITCLNKLDAGSDERIALTTRDEQNVMVVTYREVKRGLESAFHELRNVTGQPNMYSGPGLGSVGRR